MVEDPALPQVIASIRDAFPPHPLDPTEPDDAWADTYLDVVKFRADLQGKRWDELDLKFMNFHGETIHYLEPPAFGELLPAFLVTVIEHEEQTDMLSTFVLSALTPPTDVPTRLPRYRSNLASLTGAQQHAVVGALAFLAKSAKYEDNKKEARQALEGVRSTLEELSNPS